MSLTLRFFSLPLALAAALPLVGCSLDRDGSADDLLPGDAPVGVEPVPVPTGQVATEAGAPVAAPARSDAEAAPAPGLQTDAASADRPQTPSADIPDAGAPEPDARSEPPAPPAAPEPSDQPAPDPQRPEPPPPPPPPPEPAPSNPRPPAPQGFALESAAFRPGESLPRRFVCDGPSPPFSWSNPPPGTRSYVLALEQNDYRTRRVLWAMTNIPVDRNQVPEGFVTERGRFGAPVCGASVQYTYTLYALAASPSWGTGVQSVTRTVRGAEPSFQPSGELGRASITAFFNP